MKTITLEKSKEKHTIQGEERDLKFEDKSLLKEVINSPVEGIDIAGMRQRLRLLDKLEAAEDNLELEDSEFDFLKNLIEKFKWGLVSKHVLNLCEKFIEK